MSDPLAGLRVLLTRASDDNAEWAERLRPRGVDAIELACIASEALPPAAAPLERELDACDWLALASRRGAAAVAELRPTGLPDGVRVACVGPATASAARERLGRADLVAPEATAAALGRALAERAAPGARVLVAAAADGRTDVEDALSAAGVEARRVAVYRTRPAEGGADAPEELAPDAVFLASPSAVTGLLRRARLAGAPRVIAIGPTTAAAARAAGLEVHAEARTRGLDGLCAALVRALTERPDPENGAPRR